MLGVDEVVEGKTDFNLQKADPFFTGSNGNYYDMFEEKLKNLSASNSKTTNCIEEFLVHSEREWINAFRGAKLGISKSEFSARSSV
jgi:alpha-1,3-glucan synthase